MKRRVCQPSNAMRVGREGGSRGPGAGPPSSRAIRMYPFLASVPVTRCATIMRTSDSTTAPVRVTRAPGNRRTRRWTTGCVGSNPEGSSVAPQVPGAASSAASAPGPHASAVMLSACVKCSVAGPSGVRVATHAPSESTAIEGSNPPADSPVMAKRRSTGARGEKVREGTARLWRSWRVAVSTVGAMGNGRPFGPPAMGNNRLAGSPRQ